MGSTNITCYYENVVSGPATPDRQIAADSGAEAAPAATRVMNNAKQACNISEDSAMLVVEMHSYLEDQNPPSGVRARDIRRRCGPSRKIAEYLLLRSLGKEDCEGLHDKRSAAGELMKACRER